jgi:thiamine-phosphate pyrophosphorylase
VTDRRGLIRAGPETACSPEEQAAQLVETIRRVCRAGVDWVQLREKDLEGRALAELARQALGAAGGQARVIVNDRLDVAIAVGAGGVHLGGPAAGGLPVTAVRRWCRAGGAPAGFLVGASCHSLAEARAAERDGADYIFFGPIFPTPAKLPFGPPQGLERLEEVCRNAGIPVLAIGGVTTENAGACFARGARGIAAIRLFQQAQDPAAVVARLRRG